MTCNCMKDDCDFALGCKADNPGTWFFLSRLQKFVKKIYIELLHSRRCQI